MVRRCWVNFQCRGVLLIWIIVGQGPIALAVGAGGGCLDIFSLIYHFSFLSPSLWETARYRLKYCLKGPLSPKQPTNQIRIQTIHFSSCFDSHTTGNEKNYIIWDRVHKPFQYLNTFYTYALDIMKISLFGCFFLMCPAPVT